MSDVENINDHAVGFAFLRFYRQYPEIGMPLTEQEGDVGGTQTFANAILTWTGEKVSCEWISSDTPPGWMDGATVKEFEV